MYSITINTKDAAELARITAMLAGQYPVKTLEDFGLQEITEYLDRNGMTVSVNGMKQAEGAAAGEPVEEAPEEKPKKASSKKAKAETAETVSQEVETPEEPEKPSKAAGKTSNVTPTPDSEALKDAAIKSIMGVYAKPEGKKAANELLKEFGVKNFHLIPEDRWVEFHDKTVKALKAAGL
jgi:hypothetical protein